MLSHGYAYHGYLEEQMAQNATEERNLAEFRAAKRPRTTQASYNPTKRDWLFTSFSEKLIDHVVDYYNWQQKLDESDGAPQALPQEALKWAEGLLLKAKYMVCQIEKAPDTNREHVQGYIMMINASRRSTVQTLIGDEGAHFEERRGTVEEAAAYCQKEDTRHIGPITLGSLVSRQGMTEPLTEAVIHLHTNEPCVFMTATAYHRILNGYDSSDEDEGIICDETLSNDVE